MINNLDEFNFNSNSPINSIERLNFRESPILKDSHDFLQNNTNNMNNLNNIYNNNSIKEINTRNYNPQRFKGNDAYLNNFSQQLEYPFQREDYLNNLFDETKYMQNDYNDKRYKLIKENEEMEEKKKKLINAYYCLNDFKNKLLEKEKELINKETNLEEYENILKNNENILKNNLDNFDEYIKNKSNELKLQFEQIKIIQNQREIELKRKEEQLLKMIEMYSLNNDLNSLKNNLNNLNQEQNENSIFQKINCKLSNNNSIYNNGDFYEKNILENDNYLGFDDDINMKINFRQINDNKSRDGLEKINNYNYNDNKNAEIIDNYCNNYTLGNTNNKSENENDNKNMDKVKEEKNEDVDLDKLEMKINNLLSKYSDNDNTTA